MEPRETRIERVAVSAYEIPTDAEESDGTLEWRSTVLVVVEASSAGVTGLGYTYASAASATVARDTLAEVVVGRGAMAIPECHRAMLRAVRNLGRRGIAATAISAVDTALWDLKARMLGVALVSLLGDARERVPVYGSGGFTSYDDERLQRQLAGWVAQGIRSVKLKVGREPARDPRRVLLARQAVGDGPALFVDANGAYARKQALHLSHGFAQLGVTWFEEPVSSDDLEGLRLLRDRVPAPIEIAAGEYGYEPFYFERMLSAGAVDVLQADATRCGGVTGFLAAAALADAHGLPLSSHCAPALHAHLGCACERVRHLEYFHDHARIESMLFDGALEPVGGALTPARDRPGLGLSLRRREAQAYALGGAS